MKTEIEHKLTAKEDFVITLIAYLLHQIVFVMLFIKINEYNFIPISILILIIPAILYFKDLKNSYENISTQ